MLHKTIRLSSALLAVSLFHSALAETKQPWPAGVTFIAKGSVVPGAPEAWKFRFKNGLTLIALPDARNPAGTFRMTLNAGSDREQLGGTGLAHFFEHMMFRKIEGEPEGSFDTFLNEVGGSNNAHTGPSHVTFYDVFPGPALNDVLAIESRRFQKLDLVDPYFSTEKGAVISERKLNYENNPSRMADEAIRAVTERGTPYEWFTIGAKRDVEGMKIEDVKRFYKTFFVPQNALAVVGGPFDVAQIVKSVHQQFASWQGEPPPVLQPLPKDYTTRNLGKSFICGAKTNDKTYTYFYPSLDTSYRSLFLATIVEEMLDDHPEGKIERRLVTKRLARGFSFGKVFWQQQSQPVMAQFILGSEQNFDAVANFWKESVATLLQKPLDARMKKILLKQLAVSRANVAQKMTSLAETLENNEFYFHNFLIEREDETIVKKLTEKELRNWIRNNLSQDKSYLTATVPEKFAKPCETLATTKQN